jgi:hypothetical protein
MPPVPVYKIRIVSRRLPNRDKQYNRNTGQQKTNLDSPIVVLIVSSIVDDRLCTLIVRWRGCAIKSGCLFVSKRPSTR